MLFIVGLGLGDEKDITLRGLEAVKKCEKVYIEAYTSLLSFGLSSDGLSTLEKLYGKSITLADREIVEEKADGILSEARESDVAFLVVGDPFGATTHSDLVVRAKKMGLEVKVVHNASVMNAIGVYIRVKEPSLESLCRGRKQYEPPRYMTINTAIEQLLEVEKTQGGSAYNEDTDCVGFARLGSEDQMIVAGTMRQLQTIDFGTPLHCLVIVGKTHPVEEEMLDFYKFRGESLERIDDGTI
ncbi:putative diphthine methyl ester synthase [Quercus suber]|uniref:diphthine methyl ester synthase n=1 Tax=Quercus suber TaxID=58331 RepID=A0AAW0LRR1_QUESU